MIYESTLPGWLLLALPVTIFPGQPRFPTTTLGRPLAPLHLLSCSPTYPAAAPRIRLLPRHIPLVSPGLLHFTASIKPPAYPNAVSSCFQFEEPPPSIVRSRNHGICDASIPYTQARGSHHLHLMNSSLSPLPTQASRPLSPALGFRLTLPSPSCPWHHTANPAHHPLRWFPLSSE